MTTEDKKCDCANCKYFKPEKPGSNIGRCGNPNSSHYGECVCGVCVVKKKD
jgi:hypothetical protein